MIKDIESYNPSNIDDYKLQNDWSVIVSWYFALKTKDKSKYTKKQIFDIATKIIKELIERKKYTFNFKTMSSAGKELSIEILKKIIKKKLNVEDPHGDLIFEGKEKGLLLGEDRPLDEVYLLMQGNRALGYIRFGSLKEGEEFGVYNYRIDSKTFDKMKNKHKVSKEEKEVRWPEQKYLWYYPVCDFFQFGKPIKLQVQLDLKLSKDLKSEDISPEYLKRVNNFTLVKIHGLLHHLFNQRFKEKKAIELVVNAHVFTIDEIYERKMEHRLWDELDVFSKKYQIHKIQSTNSDISHSKRHHTGVLEAHRTIVPIEDDIPIILDSKRHTERENVVLQHYIKEPEVPSEIKSRENKHSGMSNEQVQKANLNKLPIGFFVMQEHFRGKSAHLDLRIKKNGSLCGWTIANQVAGKIKEPVDTFEEANKYNNDSSVWKFKSDNPPTKHCFAVKKSKHPIKWLLKMKDIHKEGEVGATKFEEGVFTGIDKGLLYFGSGGEGSHGISKPLFFEYFLRGKKFKGKLIFRALEAGKKWTKIPEGEHWECWFAKDEYPYILTRSARLKRDWLPIHGRSALPMELEVLVPDDFKYWKKHLSKENKFTMIDQLYNFFIDVGIIAANKLPIDKKLSVIEKEVDFVLQRIWWRGPEIVKGQKQNNWCVKLNYNNEVINYNFGFKIPIQINDEIINSVEILKVKSGPLKNLKLNDWMQFEGEIGPGELNHPKEIKKLSLHVDIVDRGKVKVTEDSDNFKSLEFNGNKLKGHFILTKEDMTSILWFLRKLELPANKAKIIK